MDEKLRTNLKPIICRECSLLGKVACVDDCPKIDLVASMIEQAFRDAHWIEPQQPEEGELVPNPYRCFCKLVRRMSDAEADEDYASHKFDAGRQAQLAHTMRSLKAQGWVRSRNG